MASETLQQTDSHHLESGEREGRIPILISGLPGKMATLVAEAIHSDERFVLLSSGLSSERHSLEDVFIGHERVFLSPHFPLHLRICHPGQTIIAVDFTTPPSANINAQLFAESNAPFVMGTTGGNRDEMVEVVRRSQINAVIAPNMAISVVEVQDQLNRLTETSPNCFHGWHMRIRESHQAAKRDVSGTARAFQAQLEQLGAVMDGEIASIRDPEVQRQLGIQNLDGHAYHWITLTGPDGETREFTTAIEGRAPYVEGTLAAIRFLARQMRNGSQGEVFTMSDVVRDLRRTI